jgi:Adenylate and Guanylate cyclase catalytic domain
MRTVQVFYFHSFFVSVLILTINLEKATYIGEGDQHEAKYDHMEYYSLVRGNYTSGNGMNNVSDYENTFRLYPSTEMEEGFHTNKPIIYASIVVAIFFFIAMIFMAYNFVVQRRQNKVMDNLRVTSKVIASLFPANVLDRLIKDAEEEEEEETAARKESTPIGALKNAIARTTQKAKLQNFLDDGHGDYSHIIFKTKPIADLYPSATVMYADIAGFTAWSSVREPCQVFTLLETLFKQYDVIAKRRRIFKVETIGDCYVAVCGVPHPRSDHAIAMARFARDCVLTMHDLGKKLEVELGPDTSGKISS